MWPLFLLLVAAGANWAWRRIAARERRGIVSQFVLLEAFAWVVAGYASYELRGFRGKWWGSISRASAGCSAAAVTWIQSNTSASELVASEGEGAVFLYSGRRTVPVRSETPDVYLRDIPAIERARDGLEAMLAASPVSVVVAGSRKTAEAADVLVASTPPVLQPGVDFPGGVAYRVSSSRPR
jgi:hypothetical protein